MPRQLWGDLPVPGDGVAIELTGDLPWKTTHNLQMFHLGGTAYGQVPYCLSSPPIHVHVIYHSTCSDFLWLDPGEKEDKEIEERLL